MGEVSEVAKAYLRSASILQGMGRHNAAIGVLTLAVHHFPHVSEIQDELAIVQQAATPIETAETSAEPPIDQEIAESELPPSQDETLPTGEANTQLPGEGEPHFVDVMIKDPALLTDEADAPLPGEGEPDVIDDVIQEETLPTGETDAPLPDDGEPHFIENYIEPVAAIDPIAAIQPMSAIEPIDAIEPAEAISEPGPVHTGIDRNHLALLVTLADRSTWSREDFEAMAAEFGLMPDDALATLNDFAFDRFGEMFAAGDDPIELNIALIPDMTT